MNLDKNNTRGPLGVEPAQNFFGGEKLLPKHLVSRWLVK